MTRTSNKTRILAAAALLLPVVSCGPKVVVARLATPTAGVSAPVPTPTPRPPTRPAAPPPPSATSAPPATPTPMRSSATATATETATPPAPRPTATPTTRPTRVSSPTPTAAERTAQAAPSPTVTATAPPARPVPSATATAPPPPPAPATSPASPPAVAGAPAEVSFVGEWDFRADAGKGIIAGTLRFRSAGVGLAGVYVGVRGNTTELSNLRAAGGRISFDLVTPTAVWHLEGALAADRIDGTFQTAERTIRWTAARKPSP